MQYARRRGKLTISLALSTMMLAGMSLAQDTPIPEHRATGIQASQPVYVPNSYLSLTTSPWVSPTELAQPSSCYSLDPGSTILSLTDVTTGKETPLERANDQIRLLNQVDSQSGQRRVCWNPYALRLSPDSRWLLWPSGTKEQPTWTAMTVDGTDRREWPRYGRDDVAVAAWMRDSTHWVELTEHINSGKCERTASVYSLDSPEVQQFPLNVPSQGFLLGHFFGPQSQFVFTADGRAWLTMTWQTCSSSAEMNGVHSRADFYEILPGPEQWTLRKSSIAAGPLVSAGVFDECQISPSGNWLAWLNYATDSREIRRLVVSRSDGSDMQVIFEGKNVNWPQWTPDERKIMFHWDGYGQIANLPNGEGLYTISLDQVEARLRRGPSRLAKATPKRGAFPTATGQRWMERLAKNAAR